MRPALGKGLVPRPRLVRRLLGSSDLPLALVVAPAGYGKTTVLCQWAERDRRPFAWVTLDEGDNDPGRLLTSIVSVLDAVEPVDRELRSLVARRPPSSGVPDAHDLLSRILSSLEGRSRAFVLVLDDVHVLRAAESIAALRAIVDHLPWGSQLALASREEPGIRVGRLRANRNVVELRFDDLVMTPSEAAALLRGAGLDLGADGTDTIVRRTEGWPAGLYLAALSVQESFDRAAAVDGFGGHHRLVLDYMRDEIMSELSPGRARFMTRTAVLDKLSGPLCDAVLGRSGSGRTLAEVERSNVLLFATGEEGRYRCHGLLRQMLKAKLRQSEPELESDLHRRAALWHARDGDIDRAIRHAIATRDADFAGHVLWGNLPRYVNYGHNAKVQRWLHHFADEQIAAHPALALTAAGRQLAAGDRNLTEYWASAAEHRLGDASEADASSLEAGIAILRACVAPEGIARMSEDAARAYELFPDDSAWRSICCLLVGVGRHLSGDRDGAWIWLEEGARRGAVAAPSFQTLCLAQLALLAAETGDWVGATSHAARARAQVERFGLSDYPTAALVLAVSAAVRAQDGRIDEAKVDARRAMGLAARLTDFAPWYEIELRIALARAAFRLSDAVGARGHLADASRLLRRSPDAVVLRQWLRESWDQVGSTPARPAGDRWSLTTAELRVLQFLPTHLSFPEIAGRLNVSANTVKTHSRAIYRKLEASSRAEAVVHAGEAGLIDKARIVLAEAA